MYPDNSWSDARRLEAYAGEMRVNLIRLAALVAFYGHHLVNVFIVQDEAARTGPYHFRVTLLALAWAAEVLAVHFCLSRRWVPPALKYVSTVCDLLLVTVLLILGGDSRSVFASLYFLVIASSALRLSLPLVWAATLGSMAAYAVFLGYVRYQMHLPDPERQSRPQQIIFLLALGTAGILAGQVVRQVRRLVHGFPVSEGAGSPEVRP